MHAVLVAVLLATVVATVNCADATASIGTSSPYLRPYTHTTPPGDCAAQIISPSPCGAYAVVGLGVRATDNPVAPQITLSLQEPLLRIQRQNNYNGVCPGSAVIQLNIYCSGPWQ